MIPRGAFLAISLAANVVLAGLVLGHRPESAGPPAKPVAQPAPSPGEARRASSNPEEMHATGAGEPAAFTWASLESEDYQKYIAALRGFGVPERTIRDIIMADVQKVYRPKLAALRGKRESRTNFWENRNFFGPTSGLTKAQREQLSALQKEQNEVVKGLLGKNVYREIAKDAGQPDWTERTLGPIPEELRDKVGEMTERFQQATSDLYAKADGYIDQDTQADLKTLRGKFKAELATVLTPQQLEEYELRNSDTANQMRWQLSPFEPNEKEFRAIFDYKQALEDLNPQRFPFEDSPRPSAEEMKARQQKQKDLEDALADTLGADRAKEFKMLDQWEYRNLADSGVSKEALLKVAEMKQQAESAAAEVRRDKSLSADQRTQALQAVRTETEKSLAELIGERRAKAYAGNGGYWLRNIAPKN